jgi:hypothetical protein
MKYKIIHCLSRQVIDAQDGWSYSLKEYVGDVVILKYGLAIMKHRVPWFLSLHAHLRMEKTLEDFAHLIFPQFAFKPLLLTYDIIHGLICGFGLREILEFWKSRT